MRPRCNAPQSKTSHTQAFIDCKQTSAFMGHRTSITSFLCILRTRETSCKASCKTSCRSKLPKVAARRSACNNLPQHAYVALRVRFMLPVPLRVLSTLAGALKPPTLALQPRYTAPYATYMLSGIPSPPPPLPPLPLARHRPTMH